MCRIFTSRLSGKFRARTSAEPCRSFQDARIAVIQTERLSPFHKPQVGVHTQATYGTSAYEH